MHRAGICVWLHDSTKPEEGTGSSKDGVASSFATWHGC